MGCTVITSPHWTDETRLLLAHRSPGDWGGARRGPEGPAVFRRGRGGRKCGSHYICILGAHTHSPMSQLGSRLPLSSVSAMLCGGTERGVQNWHLARVAASLTGRWGGLLGGGSQEWGDTSWRRGWASTPPQEAAPVTMNTARACRNLRAKRGPPWQAEQDVPGLASTSGTSTSTRRPWMPAPANTRAQACLASVHT